MNYLRLFVDERGESHFDQQHEEMVLVDFAPPAEKVFLSTPRDASGVLFLRVPVGWNGGWHPSPQRMFLFMLGGLAEFTASDGNKRTLAAGDVLLLEDTTGKGHNSRNVGQEDVYCGFVRLG